MAREQIAASRSRKHGSLIETMGLVMPADANAIRYFLPKAAWVSEADRLELQSYWSPDGGKTWIPGGAAIFGRANFLYGAKAGREIDAPMAQFASRKWEGVKDILHRAEVRVLGSDARFSLEADFARAPIAPQHHSISIEDIDGNFALSASSVSTSSITPAGTGRLLLALAGNDDGTLVNYNNMTYASGEMTPHWNEVYHTYFRNVGEYLLNPSTGGGVVTYSVASTQYSCNLRALALSGVDVDHVAPVGTAVAGNTLSGSTFSVNVSSATGDMVFDNVFGYASGITADGGQTVEDSDIGYDGGGVDSAATSSKAGAGTVTMGWSRTGTSFGIGVVGVNVKALAGGDPPAQSPLLSILQNHG